MNLPDLYLKEPMSEEKLLWSEEFNLGKGSAPNPEIWGRDIGDGTSHGIPGWGNNELQVYTDQNAFVNADGHLELEAKKVTDGSQGTAYYGPVQWTSARLVTKNKLHFFYGRIVIRAKVPAGVGLWPAFWMLGDTMDSQGWPLAGEIDIMEWVGKAPLEALGTLHGPGTLVIMAAEASLFLKKVWLVSGMNSPLIGNPDRSLGLWIIKSTSQPLQIVLVLMNGFTTTLSTCF